MAFSKQRPAPRPLPYTVLSPAAAALMSPSELVGWGRFELRVLAQELGVFASQEGKQAYLELATGDQALYLHALLHPVHPHAELIDAMNQAARYERWHETLADVFATLRSFKRSKR